MADCVLARLAKRRRGSVGTSHRVAGGSRASGMAACVEATVAGRQPERTSLVLFFYFFIFDFQPVLTFGTLCELRITLVDGR